MEHSGILDSWIQYMNLEKLESIKFDPNGKKTIISCDISTCYDGDQFATLVFSDTQQVLEKLKKHFPIPSDHDKKDDNELYLFFPLIRFSVKNENNNRPVEYWYPLFALNVTARKQSFYENGELNINVAEDSNYIPLTYVFKRFLGLENEDFPENLPLHHLLNRIAKSKCLTFLDAFIAFKEFTSKNLTDCKLLDNDVIFASPIVNDALNQLNIELELLKTVDLKYSPLAKNYLFNANASTIDKKHLNITDVWYGSFDNTKPLIDGQATVLRALSKGSNMIGVLGAPGTGKTTTILSIIANRLVDRAVKLAVTGEDINNLMLVVSSTNKAVNNVTDDLLRDGCFQSTSHLLFLGGSRDKIQNSISCIENLIEELKQVDFSQEDFNISKNKLIDKWRSVNDIVVRYSNLKRTSKKISLKCQSRCGFNHPKEWLTNINEAEIAFYQQVNSLGYHSESGKLTCALSWLNEKINDVKGYHNKFWELQLKYPNAKLLKIDSESDDIYQAVLSLKDAQKNIQEVSFWWIEKIFKKRGKIFDDFITNHKASLKLINCNIDVLNYAQITVLSTESDCLLHDIKLLSSMSPQLTILNAGLDELKMKVVRLINENNEANSLLTELKLVDQQLCQYEIPSFVDYYRLNTIKEQRQLFELSIAFLHQEMLRQKKEVITILRDWKDLLEKNNEYKVARDWSNRGLVHQHRLLSLAYPILSSTIASYNNYFGAFFYKWDKKNVIVDRVNKEKPIHLIIADESGMSPVHSLFPLLYKSENAVVIGDPKQLPPIITVGKVQARDFETESYSASEADLYSPLSVTAFHRASGCKKGGYDQQGNAILLNEHRRCQKDIADLFIRIGVYEGLRVRTPTLSISHKERLERIGGKNLIFYNIDGRRGPRENTNLDEADAIEKVLHKLDSVGFKLREEVAIITPFVLQEKILVKRFGDQLGHNKSTQKIGTIHKFQGVGFSVVIYSPVVFLNSDSTGFINNKPNLLNVAVSRAQELFIVCGNYYKLNSSGAYHKKLCEYCKEYGYLVDGTPDDNVTLPEGINYLNTCAHIDYFKQSLAKAKKEVIIISPWIRNERGLQKQIEQIQTALKRGISIRLYYGYKDGGVGNEKKYKVRLKNILGQNLIQLYQYTHEKCLVTDRSELAIGSFNWMSHPYAGVCKRNQHSLEKIMIRRESSVVVTDQITINSLLNGLPLLED